MPSPTTQLSKAKYVHDSLRNQCENLWASKQKHLNFRLVRSSSWTEWGRGVSWLWMRKWNDTFVIGARTRTTSAEKYPFLPVLPNVYGNDYVALPDDQDDRIAPSDYYWNGPWVIVKPEATYFRAVVDATYNNMLWGMGFYELRMRNNSNFMSSEMLRNDYGGAFLEGSSSPYSQALLTGGVVANDEGIFAYGSHVVDPVVQIYDRGIYNRGRDSIKAFRQLLDVYMDRHKILEPGWSWNGIHEGYFWRLYHQYQNRGLEGMTPTWLLNTWLSENKDNIKNANQWYRDKLMRVPNISYSALIKQWKRIGLKTGFCRIAERSTPLYNEVSPVEPDTTDYDDLIRCTN